MGYAKKLIRLPEVINRTGYRRTSIYEKIDQGVFPQPVKLGARAIAWVESEVDSWINERIQERDKTTFR